MFSLLIKKLKGSNTFVRNVKLSDQACLGVDGYEIESTKPLMKGKAFRN